MTATDSASFLAIALLDSQDNVLAANDEWQRLSVAGISAGAKLAAIADQIPGLAEWIDSSRREISKRDAQHEFSCRDLQLSAQLFKLITDSGAEQTVLTIKAAPAQAQEDGYARVRHDIKNRIGGLKLYATFLKRKLVDQEDLLNVVSKIIASLDQITIEVNKIRKLEGDGK
jgi:nitrogen-specific signal transduction histidine kinase